MVVPILSMGGIGTISTVANIIPSQVHNMVYEFLSGDTKRARQMQIEMKSLIDAVFMEVNPIPIKAAVNMLGYIEKEYRLPLCEPESKTLYEVMYQMKAYGLLSK